MHHAPRVPSCAIGDRRAAFTRQFIGRHSLWVGWEDERPNWSNECRHARAKGLALIARDNCKSDLLDWARFNRGTLAVHDLYATGTTGTLLATELDLPVVRFLSGPLGGD
jgi:hypothetical protein